MPIMTFLITLLVAFTAIVKLAQTIVEYKSAKAKQTSDAKRQHQLPAFPKEPDYDLFALEIFYLVMRYLCFGLYFLRVRYR